MSMADVGEITKVYLYQSPPFLPRSSACLRSGERNFVQNLERARRELAVNLIYNFANQTNWATALQLALQRSFLTASFVRSVLSEVCQYLTLTMTAWLAS